MLTCQCGSQDFADLRLYYTDSDPEYGSDEGEVYSRIEHRNRELQTIYRAWQHVDFSIPRGYKLRSRGFGETPRDYRERRRRENYEAMSDEAKLWHDAGVNSFNFKGIKTGIEDGVREPNEPILLRINLVTKMCTSCGKTDVYGDVAKYNPIIDTLHALAVEKLNSMEQEEQRESDALKEAINQRNAADAEIERLKEELAKAEQVHDDANERVGDGRKNLSDQNQNVFNPFKKNRK